MCLRAQQRAGRLCNMSSRWPLLPLLLPPPELAAHLRCRAVPAAPPAAGRLPPAGACPSSLASSLHVAAAVYDSEPGCLNCEHKAQSSEARRVR